MRSSMLDGPKTNADHSVHNFKEAEAMFEPHPRSDKTQYRIDGRFPNLAAILGDAMMAVYGLVGHAERLELDGLDYSFDAAKKSVTRVVLRYQDRSNEATIQVVSSVPPETEEAKWDWAERYEFAFKYKISGEPSVVVAAQWVWPDGSWLIKRRMPEGVRFIGASGLRPSDYAVILDSLIRIDDRPDVIREQQQQIRERMPLL